MEKVLFLESPLKERIWGSNYFNEVLHLTKSTEKIGELWSCSGHANGPSVIANGEFKGMSLDKLYEAHPELFNYEGYNEFPILVKLIATSDRLSVQIHPNDEYAKRVENQYGKTEGWLILDQKEDSRIVVGHNAHNKEELEAYIDNDDFDHLLNERKVEIGDFYPIYPGTIHAIGKDLLILEIQQSSDVTYRFYDYHRKDKFGNERELHLTKAKEVTRFEPYKETIHNCLKENLKTLWDNNYFSIDIFSVKENNTLKNDTNKALICSVMDGELEILNHKLHLGESFIIPANTKEVEVLGNGKLTVTLCKDRKN